MIGGDRLRVEGLSFDQLQTADLPFQIHNLVYSRDIASPIARESQPADPFGDNLDHLIGSREFWNVVTFRRETTLILLMLQEKIVTTIDELTGLIVRERQGAERSK